MSNRPRHLDICSVINSRPNNHLVLEVQATDNSSLCDITMETLSMRSCWMDQGTEEEFDRRAVRDGQDVKAREAWV